MGCNWAYLKVFYPLDEAHHDEAGKLMGRVVIKWLRDHGAGNCVNKRAPLKSTMPVELYFDDRKDAGSCGIQFSHADETVADPGLVAALISALQKRFAGKDGAPFVFSYAGDVMEDEFYGGAFAVLPDGRILHCDPEETILGQANAILLRQKNAAASRKQRSRKGKA